MNLTLPLENPHRYEVFGERVRDARVIQRMRASAVAEKAGFNPDRYSKIENADWTLLESDKAFRLASALGFHLRFLTAPPITPVQNGALLFRARKAMTKGEGDQLVAWARLIGDFLYYAEDAVRFPSQRLPRFAAERSPAIAAKKTREALAIPAMEPIPHLVRLLERTGVFIANLAFEAELHARHHDAFSTWVGGALDQPLIVTRALASWERIRLSVGHELGHLVMHRARRDGDLEAEAYQFGAEFLLPSEALRDEWPGRATLNSLLPLKRRWGVSLSALIEHGYRNSLLDTAERSNLYKQLSNRKDRLTGERWRVQEPGWLDREPERPKLIAKIGEIAYGPDATLETISKSSCHWPDRFIKQLIAGQDAPWAKQLTGGEVVIRPAKVRALRSAREA